MILRGRSYCLIISILMYSSGDVCIYITYGHAFRFSSCSSRQIFQDFTLWITCTWCRLYSAYKKSQVSDPREWIEPGVNCDYLNRRLRLSFFCSFWENHSTELWSFIRGLQHGASVRLEQFRTVFTERPLYHQTYRCLFWGYYLHHQGAKKWQAQTRM